MDLLTSDPAILVFTAVGLVATGVSILRDARAQRRRANIEQLPVATRRSEKLAA
jgi:hypothetical protein